MGGEGTNFIIVIIDWGKTHIAIVAKWKKTHPQNFLVCSPSSNVTILYFKELENGEGFCVHTWRSLNTTCHNNPDQGRHSQTRRYQRSLRIWASEIVDMRQYHGWNTFFVTNDQKNCLSGYELFQVIFCNVWKLDFPQRKELINIYPLSSTDTQWEPSSPSIIMPCGEFG